MTEIQNHSMGCTVAWQPGTTHTTVGLSCSVTHTWRILTHHNNNNGLNMNNNSQKYIQYSHSHKCSGLNRQQQHTEGKWRKNIWVCILCLSLEMTVTERALYIYDHFLVYIQISYDPTKFFKGDLSVTISICMYDSFVNNLLQLCVL